jgi:hypothetical protein
MIRGIQLLAQELGVVSSKGVDIRSSSGFWVSSPAPSALGPKPQHAEATNFVSDGIGGLRENERLFDCLPVGIAEAT